MLTIKPDEATMIEICSCRSSGSIQGGQCEEQFLANAKPFCENGSFPRRVRDNSFPQPPVGWSKKSCRVPFGSIVDRLSGCFGGTPETSKKKKIKGNFQVQEVKI